MTRFSLTRDDAVRFGLAQRLQGDDASGERLTFGRFRKRFFLSHADAPFLHTCVNGIANVQPTEGAGVYIVAVRRSRNMSVLGEAAFATVILSNRFSPVRAESFLAFFAVWCATIINRHSRCLALCPPVGRSR